MNSADYLALLDENTSIIQSLLYDGEEKELVDGVCDRLWDSITDINELSYELECIGKRLHKPRIKYDGDYGVLVKYNMNEVFNLLVHYVKDGTVSYRMNDYTPSYVEGSFFDSKRLAEYISIYMEKP